MPPGRKKGASKADNLAQLSVGDLVLAKVKGFPAWPAKISRAEDWQREPDPKKVFVHFFGTEEIAFVAPADIQVFNLEARKSLLTRLQGKSVKFFSKAVREICEACDKLNTQNQVGLKDNDNMSTGFPLEEKVQVESKVACAPDDVRHGDYMAESRAEQQNLHTRGNESGKDVFIPKLEETSSAFIRSDMKCQTHGNVSLSASLKQKKDTSNGANSPYKLSSVEISNNPASLAEDTKSQLGNVALLKSNDQPTLAYYTKDSRIKKLKLDTNDSEGVTGSNVDAIICPKTIEGADIADAEQDLSRVVVESMGGYQMEKESVSESSTALKLVSEASDLTNNGSSVKSKRVRQVESEADVPKNQTRNVLSGRKRKVHSVSEKAKTADNELTCSGSVESKGEISDASGKKPLVKRRMITPSNVTEKKDGKHTESSLGDKTLIVCGTDNMEDDTSNGDSALALAKKCVLALEASSTSVRTSERKVKAIEIPKAKLLSLFNPKSPSNTSAVGVLPSTNLKPSSDMPRMKRRAVCLVDKIEERPRTPVYKGFSQKPKAKTFTPVLCSSIKFDSAKDRAKASQMRNADCTKSEAMPLERCIKSSKMTLGSHLTECPEDMMTVKSKGKGSLPLFDAPVSEKKEFDKSINSKGERVTGSSQVHQPSDTQKILDTDKGLKMSSKNTSRGEELEKTLDENPGSQYTGTYHIENVTPKKKSTSGDRPNIMAKVQMKMNHAASQNSLEKRSSLVGMERVDISYPSVLHEPRMSESDKSMKLLIAAAQAKRMAAHSHSISQPVSFRFDPVGVAMSKQSSPLEDPRHASSSATAVSPSKPQIVTEKLEDVVSSGHPSARGSLSGGNEAAVAREAFEGMIETLSRTKESIRRATRLAIDCAKYGIAAEVVEILISKLENEPKLHHRVDLFFLVDSIMQCSHNQKGIAGASYASTVEGALSRLLSAAAPSGSDARENRRQCLKVLRLWLERKILSAPVLRRYMDDIGVSNDDSSVSMSFKRPSRAERSVDDPIREMEGMLVDEYGSNTSMQLPGFLTLRIFDDEDEDEDVNPPNILIKPSDEALVPDGNQDLLAINSSDSRNCIQKNTNGELEDISKSCSEFQQLPVLPLLSSPSPPLPSSPAPSPPPPPPPQQSPSHPPPSPPYSSPPPLPPQPPPPPASPPPPPPSPPPPLTTNSQPFASHPPPLPSHVPSYHAHASFASIPTPPSVQLSASARPVIVPLLQNKYAVSPQNLLSGQSFTISQAQPPELAYQPCVPSNPLGEIHPIHANAIHGQYGPPLPAVAVRAPPPQPLANHFSYANSMAQQRPYHTSYGLHPPEGNRPYGNESQFPHSLHSMWTNGMQMTASSTSQPNVQEGYYQPACQRPATNTPGFQQPPGHGAVHAWPRPDIPVSNCWRPS